ncbi:hypothetical protein QUB70_26630 [Microcoleus sp. A003_D6]
MPIPQEKKICGMGILPVLVIFARGLFVGGNKKTWTYLLYIKRILAYHLFESS